MKKIEIFTDGSCKGNPGPGGWAAVLLKENATKPFSIIHGNALQTTNNRMEMMAVIESLRYVKTNDLQEKEINLYSDSNLVVQTINQGWKRKKNLDLWKQFDTLNKGLNISYFWIKGHADNHWNEEVDALALNEAKKADKFIRENGLPEEGLEPDEDQATLF